MKKKNNEMLVTEAEVSKAIVKTGVYDDRGGELALVVGYAASGDFGYFICYERSSPKGFTYTDQISFKKKVNEKTYQEVLNELKSIVETHQNK